METADKLVELARHKRAGPTREYAVLCRSEAAGERLCTKQASRLAALLEQLELTPDDFAGDVKALQEVAATETRYAEKYHDLPEWEKELAEMPEKVKAAEKSLRELKARQAQLSGLVVWNGPGRAEIRAGIERLKREHPRVFQEPEE